MVVLLVSVNKSLVSEMICKVRSFCFLFQEQLIKLITNCGGSYTDIFDRNTTHVIMETGNNHGNVSCGGAVVLW